MEKFMERLKELREEKGLSQLELAKEIGFGRTAVCYWENGQRVPSALAIIALANYFDVTTDYLLGRTD